MGTLLVRHATVLVTMDGSEIADGGLLARDGRIEKVGPTDQLPSGADEVVDLSGHIVLPGLVNTHHHLYQTLTRVIPEAQDAALFDWLRSLYPIWARLTPEHIRTSTTLGLVELALSGATTVFDHCYLWPNGARVDDQFEGADGINIRFHAARGSMSMGQSQGGLPPDSVVESEDRILEETRQAVEVFHDPSDGSLRRMVVAPCSPFSVTPELMAESAVLARDLGVGLHTHLAETMDENQYCLERFGKRPLDHVEDLGWSGSDVWFAHAVHLSSDEISQMAASRTGVSHCPTSNMRLGSGMAPITEMVHTGVPVGLGVDGSASNDSSHMLAEVRQALLLNRVGAGSRNEQLMTARQALELGTVGGASVLGRSDIGRLAPGKYADFVAIDLNRVEFAGALHDPVAAVVMCSPARVDHSWVGAKPLVSEGQVVGVEENALVREHNRLAAELLG